MECETAREAISAVLDGEEAGVLVEDLEEHLLGCAACRTWREAAHEVTRRARIAPAAVSSRHTGEVVAAVRAHARVPRRQLGTTAARTGLAVVAAGQIAATAPVLLFGSDHSAPFHVAHEIGAFGIALAVGFLVAAWQPGRALGMRPVVGAAAVLLAVTAVADLTSGLTSAGDEAPHLLAIAGWLLVCYLAATCPPTLDTPAPPARLRGRSLAAWRAAGFRRRTVRAETAETSLTAVFRQGLAAQETSLGGSAVPGADEAGNGEPMRERAAC
jgi:predicted anti-sigma-YlaC factor YlaD